MAGFVVAHGASSGHRSCRFDQDVEDRPYEEDVAGKVAADMSKWRLTVPSRDRKWRAEQGRVENG